MRLLRDYQETLRGELALGAPDSLGLRWECLLWAARRSGGVLGLPARVYLWLRYRLFLRRS